MSDGVVVQGTPAPTDEFGEEVGMSETDIAAFNSKFESLFKTQFDQHKSPFASDGHEEAVTPDAEPGTEPPESAPGASESDSTAASSVESDGSIPDTLDATSQDGVGEPPTPEPPESGAAFTLAGASYTEPELTRALATHQWFARLPDHVVQGIDAYLSGQYQLVPLVAPATAAGPVSPSSPPPQVEEEEWLDPRAAQEIQSLRAEVEALKGNVTSTSQQQMETALRNQQTIIETTAHSFAEEYSLAEDQMSELVSVLNNAQILSGLHHQHNGDVAKAMRAGLEMTLWSTPSLRDSVLARQAEVAQLELAQQTQDDERRKQQLSALSGSGGSAPRRDPIPRTPEDRQRAMRDTIAAAMADRPQ